ncbi:class I SAM-dependent methyltransferase [Nocardioides sp. CFH 31398]|uniref:class I SAM-dependent methyltransferase n=1 Tax=Nocardioides sp. CFH 31398 TaxID=2919579 RepID=UPI001F0680FF|nr:methyltransferase domain-containing protein [Nocardioides sp. CFH 31398]MCH1865371.1 methyltransferase domain-containing protein [Nocardioides sp. CFH 31398]MCH1868755.1 methyltransferase domain-containing protein [Nocardioides sp. CFH 31398]
MAERRFQRYDEGPDAAFYAVPRFVTHIDDAAIGAVADLYEELGVGGAVLDLMSSWVSHLRRRPERLTVLGMNAEELAANPMATERVVHDLNVDPTLSFADDSFDAVLCCVSIDYLVDPVRVLAEVARVLRPGAPVVVTFSNRCFPTKAVRAWLETDDAGHCALVVDHLARAGGFTPARVERRTPSGRYAGDPLFSVVAEKASAT